MKWIKYQIKIEHDTDGDGAPDITTLTEKTVEYSESAYQLALSEAYQGQVTIEDDGQPEPEPAPTLEDRVTNLESAIERGAVPVNLYDALASAIYVSRQTLNGGSIDTDDKRIRASGLYEDWAEGSYQVGDIRNAKGQTWECFQAHDNATYPDINPDNAAWYTFWRPLHGTSPETARPFVPVQGSHDMYRTGEYMIYTDGLTYRCKQDTNFSPEDYAQAWEAVKE